MPAVADAITTSATPATVDVKGAHDGRAGRRNGLFIDD